MRISKEDLHVRIISEKDKYEWDVGKDVPIRFGVVTNSATGDPIEAEVDVTAFIEDEKERKSSTKVKTNRYGYASVQLPRPVCEDNECFYEDTILSAKAITTSGKTGGDSIEGPDLDDDQINVFVNPRKSVLSPGAPLVLDITSNSKNSTVFLKIDKSYSTVNTRLVKLDSAGRSTVTVPFLNEFEGVLTIIASVEDDGDVDSSYARVVYPSRQGLDVDLQLDKSRYGPAENAALSVSARRADGTSGETAIGTFIRDESVEQQAALLNNGFVPDPLQAYQDLTGSNFSFGGVRLTEILTLKPDSRIDQELEEIIPLVLSGGSYNSDFPDQDHFSENRPTTSDAYRKWFAEKLFDVENSLKNRFNQDGIHPTNRKEFDRILEADEVDFSSLRDPWGQPFRVDFSHQRDKNYVYIRSNGPNRKNDKESENGDSDDFNAMSISFKYFQRTGNEIDRIVKEYNKTYPSDLLRKESELLRLLKESEFDVSKLVDPWGRKLIAEFSANDDDIVLKLKSRGEKTGEDYSFDDFVLYETRYPYFQHWNTKALDALNKRAKVGGGFPRDVKSVTRLLKNAGVDLSRIKDGWGRSPYLELTVEKVFADRLEVISGKNGDRSQSSYRVIPVTREVATVVIRSLGESGEKSDNSYDNPILSRFYGVISETSVDGKLIAHQIPKAFLADNKGAIAGWVTDSEDRPINGATVRVITSQGLVIDTQETDDDGRFVAGSLRPREYRVEITKEGFNKARYQGVRILDASITQFVSKLTKGDGERIHSFSSDGRVLSTLPPSLHLRSSYGNIVLSSSTRIRGLETSIPGTRSASSSVFIDGLDATNLIGAGLQVVEDATVGVTVESSDSSASNRGLNVVTKPGSISDLETGIASKASIETPRVRKYFPETLLWLPFGLSDENGRARLNVKLADTLTTWKIYALASDKEGRTGAATKDLKTFLPFFVNAIPPQVLTVGDRISLPAQTRNYLQKTQDVKVTLRNESWFSSARLAVNLSVAANSSENAVFDLQAIRPKKDAVVHLTAKSNDESDAIEKPLSVVPDGMKDVQSETALFTESAKLDLRFGPNALEYGRSAYLKVFPDLRTHVADAVNGILQRPHGCGEQTVSTTFPHLLMIQMSEKGSETSRKSLLNLQRGYDRILGYQGKDGGFTYWGGENESSDLALTVYALTLLVGSAEHIDIDEAIVKSALGFIQKQQRSDGSWSKVQIADENEKLAETQMLTSSIIAGLTELNPKDYPEVSKLLENAVMYFENRSSGLTSHTRWRIMVLPSRQSSGRQRLEK